MNVSEVVISIAKNPTIERTYGNILEAWREPKNIYVTRSVKSPPRNPAAMLPRQESPIDTMLIFAGPSTSSLLFTSFCASFMCEIDYKQHKSTDRDKYISKIENCKVFYTDEVGH